MVLRSEKLLLPEGGTFRKGEAGVGSDGLLGPVPALLLPPAQLGVHPAGKGWGGGDTGRACRWLLPQFNNFLLISFEVLFLCIAVPDLLQAPHKLWFH